MNATAPTDAPAFDVVLLGSGLGIYALTRAFHENHGVVSDVVAAAPSEAMRRSITCRIHEIPPGADDETRLAALDELSRARPTGRPALLLCNTDGDIEFIARHAERLAADHLLRQPDLPVVLELADKARFAELCTRLGVPQPLTAVIDFRSGERPALPELDAPYPLVAKPAVAQPHVAIRMPGKKKIYFVASAAELEDLVGRLHAAGFRDRFVLQELIPGDDTTMRSITAYRDAHGEVTLLAGADVLLEEHTPDALGRPAAMITATDPDTLAQARRLLDATGYVGYANADLKIDPRDGVPRFLEINPRIGRNNYYVTGAGVDVTRFIVEDAVHGRRVEPVIGLPSILYSIVPDLFLRRYVTDPERWQQVRAAARRRRVNPWANPREGLWVRAYARVVELNHVRKFLAHYPRPTDTGF